MDKVQAVLNAIAAGDIKEVERLLNEDLTLVTASSMLGSQPIHAAWFAGQTAVVDLLLTRGVQLDFFLACELGKFGVVVNAIQRDPEITKQFSGAGSTGLHRACYWGQTENARLLLEHGADPNAITKDGFLQIAPLGCAVATPDTPNPSDNEDVVLELVKVLIESGANVNARRRDGLTALHSTAWRGHLRVMSYLLSSGADATIEGTSGAHEGQTAIDLLANMRE